MCDTSSMDVPNSRAIAKQLLVLSQDVDNQPFIVQEQGCLAGLVSYIDHPDIDVVLMATRALQFLSSNPRNKDLMKAFPGLIQELTNLNSNPSAHSRAKEFVGCTLDNLGIDEEEEKCEEIDQENNPFTMNTIVPKDTKPRNTKNSPENTSPNYSSVKLQIDHMEDEQIVHAIKQSLLDTAGVISVVLDDKRGRATIGLKTHDKNILDKLQRVIHDAGSQSTPWPPVESEENMDYTDDLPGYLDESEYDDADDDTAVTRWGGNSLSARLERQRLEEEKEKQARMISKVSNAFQNASAWLMGW